MRIVGACMKFRCAEMSMAFRKREEKARVGIKLLMDLSLPDLSKIILNALSKTIQFSLAQKRIRPFGILFKA